MISDQSRLPGGAIFDQATLPMATATLDFEMLEVNAAFCQLVGQTADSLVGARLGASTPTMPDAPTAPPRMEAARSGGAGEFVQEWRRHDDDGELLHLRVAWALSRDPADGSAYLVCVFEDQTRQVEAEREFISREARWRAMLTESPNLSWTADDTGIIESVSDGAAASLGEHPQGLLQQPVFDLVHPGDLPAFRQLWTRVRSGIAKRDSLQCRLLHTGGGWIWMQLTLTDMRGNAHVRALVCHALEITSLRDVKAIERRHEARFRAVFDQSAVPQVLCNLEGILTEANDAFCALLGLPREQLLGRPVRDLNHPSDDGQADLALSELLRGTSESTQVLSVLRDGKDRPVPGLANAQVMRDENGAVVGISIILNDLAELRAAEGRQRQQEEYFAALAQRASDVAVVADATGLMLYASPGLTRVLGYTIEDFVGSEGWDFIHPDDIPEMRVAFGRVAAGGETETAFLRARNAAGEWRWLEETMHNCLDTPVQGIVCNLRDITDRVAAEAEQKASMLLYRTVAENVDEGLWLATEDGTTVFVNDRMGTILGLATSDIYARSLDTILDAQQSQLMRDRMASRVGREPERYEVSYNHPDGTARILLIAAASVDSVADGQGGTMAMVSDVTRTRQLENELRRAALYDSLAGLPNRTLLMDRLKHALDRATTGTAVLFVDLDQFKLVNDARGHAEGDDVLVQVAARLSTSVRPSDTVARLGGDEFVVICEDVDTEVAASIAQDLLSVLDKPFALATGPLHISASIGIAVSPPHSAETLVGNADIAMYAAKVAGRGRIQHFDARLAAHTAERRELGAELELALVQDLLTMHYQPVIDLCSGRVVGMESLARWERAGGGQIAPDRFVAIAEEAGLAHQLDRWALRHALRGVSQLRAEGAVHADSFVSVNLSARNLSNPALEENLLEWTAAAGLPAHGVLLEITESAIMSDATAAVALLQRLRETGFLIAVDDFGTGHSSLAYLRNLPLTTLKIDRSFVAAIDEDRNALAIAGSIIDLATAMGLSVIAEGVETIRHAELLRDLGCHWAQGWLWSPAVPLAEARQAHTMVRHYDAHTRRARHKGQVAIDRSPR